ncbi:MULTISPECIES: carbohydrate ABC transporter permease [unclassified Paenibacillus]|uniref:carbohydrate ABC transporter permease n=1 Tax=unclassified Paenibacillus TaxID=185978 RepID=UPI002405C913|nr:MULTISPECIES: carbohydrate ABC transporter permease [unclassified Paenibacillus]MDF9843158.1 putative aldouronate transport system permease protein [Paenibacillus sp. PastF-2]MDF9849630.1 putative aldouronate transport system permease protein [Paenibacillus sp. PastM-2]MDF9856453.1 putative aldouronate transport system permease protein [Paenibacillus sp. PastF-1]MDH6481724.1 putative aldouronate transport system permease protein [Paenibacillus sp. PastH-2]MDH6509005.1 putative aldouronate t
MIENKSLGARTFNAANMILLIVITLLCLVPLWYILMVSVSEKSAVNAGTVTLWPVGFNLLSYKKIVAEEAFFLSFWVSVKRVVLGTIVTVGVILLMAYPLSRTSRQLPYRNVYMWLLVFCMLFSGGTIPWYLTMRSYGLIDSIWGLVLSGGMPVFSVILVVNFFRNAPSALEEAAYVDGAGPWRTFLQIYIPISTPVIATITLFTVVGYWNEFFQGLVLSTNQSNYPLQTYIQQLVVSINLSTVDTEQVKLASQLNNKSLNAAKIFIAMIPVLIIYPFLQRYFITGITLGSVKE